MILALTSRNQDLAWRLGSPYFRRLGLLHRAVDTGDELLRLALEFKPQVVMVNWELPDGDGFELCGTMRGLPELLHVRVLVAVRREHLSASVLRKADRAGAHDVVAIPCSDEELFQHLAQVLGLPRRLGRRIRVEIKVGVEDDRRLHLGIVKDLGIHGARVELPESPGRNFDSSRTLQLHMKRTPASRPVTVQAQVAWQAQLPDGRGVSLGLEFLNLDSSLRSALCELAFWEVVDGTDPMLTILQGDLTESTDFGDLPQRLRGRVEFDLAGLRYINSTGIRSWTFFLESLHRVESYIFSRCSPAFLHQATMVSRILGSGTVVSLYAPYLCEECGREEMRMLDVGHKATIADLEAAAQRCAGCGTDMILDDLSDQLFGFLE